MGAEWIKFRKSLIRDGRVRIVSRNCHATTVTVLGALVTLWSLADEYADDEGVLFGWTPEDLDAEVAIEGFAAALPEEWIDTTGEFIKLPDYQEHNGTTAKARAQAADRKRRQRSREAEDATRTSVTKPSRGNRDAVVTRKEKTKKRKDLSPPYIKPPTLGEGEAPADETPPDSIPEAIAGALNQFIGGQVVASAPFLRYMKQHAKKSHYRRAAEAWNAVVMDGVDPERIIAAYPTSPRVVNATAPNMVPNPEAYLIERCFDDPPVTPQSDEDRTGGFRITDDEGEL